MMQGGGLGNNVPEIYIRGNHGNDNNSAIIIVDGLERSISDIVPEEVEKVEVMKDALAKIIYGPRAANGVLYITTKRGKANTRIIRTSVESGVNIASRVPEYLGASDYALLYNEARANDGMSPMYTAEQLKGYQQSSGPNDLLYPNVDWYDYFTRNISSYQNVMLDMSGGTDKFKYALIMNYKRGTGFEKVGKLPSIDRFNVRGNVDVKINDYLRVFADAAARLEVKEWGQLITSDVYGALSTNRPNEHPLMISAEDIGFSRNEDNIPYFGASMKSSSNLLADMEYGGFNSERRITSMFNIGLDFNLNNLVRGLGAKACLLYDNLSYFGQGQTNTYATYALKSTNQEAPSFVQKRKQSLQSGQSRTSANLKQTLGYNVKLDYSRIIGVQDISATISYDFYKNEINGSAQDNMNENLYLRGGYGYGQRYFVEAVASLMGSNRYSKGNRNFFSYSVGGSWIISNEKFMKSQNIFNFLKLKASYGVLGYDRNTDYLLYKEAWSNGDNLLLGEQNKGTIEHTTTFVRLANDLKWEHSEEFNIGLEGSSFDKRLSFEANWFNERRKDIVTGQTSNMPGVLGGFVTMVNAGSVRNWGIDGQITWSERTGNFSYEVSVNATWSKNKLLSWNQVNYPDAGTVRVGKPTDAIFGYTDKGLFGKNVQLSGSPKQNLGDYGEGSIAYEDTNDDGQIDSRDMIMIGNRFPRATLGLDISIGYKGWGLFACGTAQLGKWTLRDNSYWQIDGEDKYSVIAKDRYHSVNNPNGTYPSLTTRNASNNFVNSTFWLTNSSFFRLKNVEASYTFSFLKSGIKKLKLFARGTNLFVISSDSHLDPETANAGISTYPLYKTITGGLTITF